LAAIQSEQRRLAEEAAERKAAENEILRARAEAEQARMDADRARAEAEQAKAQAAAAAAASAAAAEKERAEDEAQKAKAQAEADAAAAAAVAEKQRAEEEAQRAKAQAEADAAAAAAAAQRKQAQDESRRASEAEIADRIKAMDAELEARRLALEEMDAKQREKEEELLRVAERASEIDFATLGVAARSEVSEPVEKGATELSVGDTSAFEESGSAWVQDQDGGMSISWTGKTASALIGVTGLKRAFAAAATVTARDDLQRIKGVGPFIAEKLNMLGITTFRQVANMTPELEDQVNTAIEFFPGRVRRDKWAAQAGKMADE
jgi:chemotaxis protein histidine kinase CheA